MWNGPGSRPGQVQDDRREGNNLPLAGLYDSHISERQEKESTINYLGYPLWRKTQGGGRMRIVDKTHIFRPPRRGRPRCVNTIALSGGGNRHLEPPPPTPPRPSPDRRGSAARPAPGR